MLTYARPATIRTALSVVIPPAVEPITLADAKAWLHVDDTADDATITSLIVAARQRLERDTGLALITQTIAQTMDARPWGREPVQLLTGPVQAITAITTFDTEDVPTVVDPVSYALDASRTAARVRLTAHSDWPTNLRFEVAAVVDLVAGYGDAGTDVPLALLLALQLLMTEWFGPCGGDVDKTSRATMRAYEALIGPYRLDFV